LIVVGISALIVILVALLIVNATAQNLSTQTRNALAERERHLAETLDTQMEALSATSRSLAATLGYYTDRSPVSTLWTASTNVMLPSNSLIRRVGVLADFRDNQYQVVLFGHPPVRGSVAPVTQLISAQPVTDPWLSAIRQQSDQ